VSYAVLARDLDAVAAAHGATRALGVSMGAGTVLRLLAERGDRFERALLLLPPPPDMQRTDRHDALLAALDAGDLEALRQGVRDDLPAGVRAEPYVVARADHLLTSTGVAAVLRALDPLPLDLSGVTTRVLVVTLDADPAHPVAAAEHWAREVPRAELVVLGPGAVFRERARLRELVRGFFG
jgi:pimeloyl-ACP methyl ester carboxylesterase